MQITFLSKVCLNRSPRILMNHVFDVATSACWVGIFSVRCSIFFGLWEKGSVTSWTFCNTCHVSRISNVCVTTFLHFSCKTLNIVRRNRINAVSLLSIKNVWSIIINVTIVHISLTGTTCWAKCNFVRLQYSSTIWLSISYF